MNESRISVRYSKALFQSAVENKILDRINNDMIFVKEICSNPEVKEVLVNPVIRPSKKSEVLRSLLEKNVHKLTLSLVDLVVRNGRESYLPAIARVFVHDTLKYSGITESVITTAVKIDPEIKKQVTGMIERVYKTRVDLKENLDESIVGGFILKVDDSYIDASIKNKLRKIRKELISGS